MAAGWPTSSPGITDAPAVLVGHSLGARVVLQAVAAGASAAGMLLFDPAGLIRLCVTPRVMAPTLPWLRPLDGVSARPRPLR